MAGYSQLYIKMFLSPLYCTHSTAYQLVHRTLHAIKELVVKENHDFLLWFSVASPITSSHHASAKPALIDWLPFLFLLVFLLSVLQVDVCPLLATQVKLTQTKAKKGSWFPASCGKTPSLMWLLTSFITEQEALLQLGLSWGLPPHCIHHSKQTKKSAQCFSSAHSRKLRSSRKIQGIGKAVTRDGYLDEQ